MLLKKDQNTKGKIMKTTDNKDLSTDKMTDKPKRSLINGEIVGPLRSLRPQKSMVRVKSLKPQKFNRSRKVSIISTNTNS